MSEDTTYECKRCGTIFCEYCGDIVEGICINCLMEYTAEEEPESDYLTHARVDESKAVQKPQRIIQD